MFGGPDGELAASLRYLSQRYSVPYRDVAGLLTDIGTEELAHMEMISAIVFQLTKDLTIDEIKAQGFDSYLSTIQPEFILHPLLGSPSLPPISNLKVILSLICMRIWQQNKKLALPMITS